MKFLSNLFFFAHVLLLFQYLNVARTLKYYGYTQFAPCFCDYPQHGSRVLLAIGRNELNLRILSSEDKHEVAFKVSRMRCWRITTMQDVSITYFYKIAPPSLSLDDNNSQLTHLGNRPLRG